MVHRVIMLTACRYQRHICCTLNDRWIYVGSYRTDCIKQLWSLIPRTIVNLCCTTLLSDIMYANNCLSSLILKTRNKSVSVIRSLLLRLGRNVIELWWGKVPSKSVVCSFGVVWIGFRMWDWGGMRWYGGMKWWGLCGKAGLFPSLAFRCRVDWVMSFEPVS